MASRRTDQHRRELGLVAGLTARDVRAEARKADVADIDGWWEGGAGARISGTVAQGFRATAVLGVDYLAAEALANGRRLAPVPAAIDPAQLATSLRVTGPVAFKTHVRSTGSPDAALRVMETRLGGAAQRLALAGERETVMAAIQTSNAIVGYRRVTAAGACKFCEMLAGRGAVYTRESATAVVGRRGQTRGGRKLGEPYHDSCRCSAEPIWADGADQRSSATSQPGQEAPPPPSSPPTDQGRGAAASDSFDSVAFERELEEANRARQAREAVEREAASRSRLARSRERQRLLDEDRPRREAAGAARDRGEVPVSLSARTERHERAMADLRSLVAREAEAVSRDNRSGVQALTEIVTLPDGRRFVSKRIHADAADAAGDVDREVLANAVGRAVGAEVPAMVRAAELELKMEFVDGTIADDAPFDLRDGAVESDSGLLMGLLDVLIGNTDRHSGNWFVRDGAPVAIDHGFAWRARLRGGFNQASEWDEFAGKFLRDDENDMSPADMAVIRGRLEALEPDFAAAGREDWFRVTMDRFDQLAAAATGDRRRLGE